MTFPRSATSEDLWNWYKHWCLQQNPRIDPGNYEDFKKEFNRRLLSRYTVTRPAPEA